MDAHFVRGSVRASAIGYRAPDRARISVQAVTGITGEPAPGWRSNGLRGRLLLARIPRAHPKSPNVAVMGAATVIVG